MNSVEESASPTKALDHDSDNLSKSSTHYHCAQCLKITEKVAFNIASEASYVYILSGQKFIKNAKNHPLWQPEAWGQTVLPDMTEKELKPTRVGL